MRVAAAATAAAQAQCLCTMMMDGKRVSTHTPYRRCMSSTATTAYSVDIHFEWSCRRRICVINCSKQANFPIFLFAKCHENMRS